MTGEQSVLSELVRASTLMADEGDFKKLISILVEQSQDITGSDTSCLYLFKEKDRGDLLLSYKRGSADVPSFLSGSSELVDFINECGKSVVMHTHKPGPFDELFLHESMHSAIALPLDTTKAKLGILILNSRKENFYSRKNFHFLDSFIKQAGGLLQSARLYKELQEYVKQIEELEKYQESIFESMTNILITTDEKNGIEYYNDRAEETMGLNKSHLGEPLGDFFKTSLNRKTLNAMIKAGEQGKEVLGLEGIYKGSQRDMDFSLNVSPLKGVRGKFMGQILLFTDQTRERELKETVNVAQEDRRVIKDMFARYLSKDIVKSLIDKPELVKLGGGTKHATVFFADIRGYTSFSEDKSPEYIIEVLNEYFSEAVEIIIKYDGYIDKFIGDCIMAAWGVPMVNEQQDSIKAVSCAVEIQGLIKDKNRKFFTGKASKLSVGFGMHTGDLVAGNLGSARRMDYTVIGDTVNLAARLEGVSEAGEIIITEDTRKYLDDRFVIEPRKPVMVKGKIKPIQIYNVSGMR